VLAVLPHAHNIFLHTLATQGGTGLIILVAFLFALMKWASGEIRQGRNISGYIIVMTTILTIVGGLTENNIGVSKYIAAYCLTVGLIGGIDEGKQGESLGNS
jgi:O-antigen ligase